MEPRTTELKLKSGQKLFAWYLIPNRPPRAIICFNHGWGEHSLRYKHWADRFIRHEYGFFIWDHIGHGQSDGKKGHIANYDVFMEEVNLAINKINQIFPGIPVVLYGHSMGGNIAINFALKESNPFNLLIATSPWIRLTNKTNPFLNVVVKIFNRILPAIQLDAPLNANGISHIKEIVEDYKTDPLNHGKITPRCVTGITDGGEYALANIDKLNKPFLLIHGDSDPITSFKASFEMSTKCKTCSFIPFKDMFHELHNEPVQEEVFNIIKEWLSGNLD